MRAGADAPGIISAKGLPLHTPSHDVSRFDMTDDFDIDDWDEVTPSTPLTPQRLRADRAQAELERLSLHHSMAQAIALTEPTAEAFQRRFADLCLASFDETHRTFTFHMLRSPEHLAARERLFPPQMLGQSGVILHHFSGPLSDRRETKSRDQMREQLAKPMALAGPQTIAGVDELFAQLAGRAPWMRPPIEHLWRSARENVAQGHGFRVDPVLLLGGAGVGKTHLVQTLAALAGMPFRRLEGGVMTASFELGGTEFTWASGTPGVAVRLIAETGVANPLILVDEVEKFTAGKGTGGDPRAALLPFLQLSTAASFSCPYLQAPVDLSRVSWLLCANSIDGLSRPLLDRLAVFRVTAPTGPDIEALVRSVFDGLDVGPTQVRRLCAEVAQGHLSLRGLNRLAEGLRRFDTRPQLN